MNKIGIYVAINDEIIGKRDLPTDKSAAASLTYKYKPYWVTVVELAGHIQARHNFTCICLTPSGRFHRKGEHFKEIWLVGIDCDNDEGSYISFDAALADDFVQRCAAILYTSPSHREDFHKFRILFALAVAFKTEAAAREFILALHWRLSRTIICDPSCKEPWRFFYGTGEGGRVEVINTEPMSEDAINELLAEYRAAMEAARPKATASEPTPFTQSVRFSDRAAARKVQYVEQASRWATNIIHDSKPPVFSDGKKISGNRHNARLRAGYLLGGYIVSGLLSYVEAEAVLANAVSANTDNFSAAMQTVRDALHSGMMKPITFEQLEAERKRFVASLKVKIVTPRLRPLIRPSNGVRLAKPLRPANGLHLAQPAKPVIRRVR